MAVESDVLDGIISVLKVLNSLSGEKFTPITDAWDLTQSPGARPFTRRAFLNYAEKLRIIYGVPVEFKRYEGLRLVRPVEIPARLLDDYDYVKLGLRLENLTQEDRLALSRGFGASGVTLARKMGARPQTISKARMIILGRQIEQYRKLKAEEVARRVQFSPGCYFEYGYSPENLTGWERETLLKGPEHSLRN